MIYRYRSGHKIAVGIVAFFGIVSAYATADGTLGFKPALADTNQLKAACIGYQGGDPYIDSRLTAGYCASATKHYGFDVQESTHSQFKDVMRAIDGASIMGFFGHSYFCDGSDSTLYAQGLMFVGEGSSGSNFLGSSESCSFGTAYVGDVDTVDWSKAKLVILGGCLTATSTSKHPKSLMERVKEAAAHEGNNQITVVGFDQEIPFGPHIGQTFGPGVDTWANAFWNAFGGGSTVQEAIDSANWWENYYYPWEDWAFWDPGGIWKFLWPSVDHVHVLGNGNLTLKDIAAVTTSSPTPTPTPIPTGPTPTPTNPIPTPTGPTPRPTGPTPTPRPRTTSDRICCNTYISGGAKLTSQNGQYTVVMQSDGNLVLYNNLDGIGKCWQASGTYGHSNDVLTMQTDGNLVVYTSESLPRSALWASNTGNHSQQSYFAIVQNDGNLVIYTQNGATALWATGTNKPRSQGGCQ